MKTVGEVSELAGVTVRTLHHYHEIGLLEPSGHSDAGYRLYSYRDLTRLQEILVWRQLGFSLAEIQALLDDPKHDRQSALRDQRRLVELQLERLGAVAWALEQALAAHENDTPLKEDSMFEGFDQAEYEQEVRERWGDTEPYRESGRRVSGYGEEEWRAIRSESEEIVRGFAELLGAGEAAAGEPARTLAERHRQHIARWFYPCSQQMHRGLGEMYVADERFARNYEHQAKGLAVYVHDAIAANAERDERSEGRR